MTKVLPFFWETQLDDQSLAYQQALWYEVMKLHSFATVQTVAMDWLKTGKRKPVPADFLQLADEVDETPAQILRLDKLSKVQVFDVIENKAPVEKPLLGCPIVLGRLLKLAETKEMHFGEQQQLNYLHSGALPVWATEEELRATAAAKDTIGMPTRDELLANMTPEERVNALQK
jgi:hypothetical protein